MKEEMESLWNAMKGSHYKRTIDKLTHSIQDTQVLEEAPPAALEMVLQAIHAQTGTFWFYERFKDGRIYPKAVCNGADMVGVHLLPGEGIAGQVIMSGASVIIPDCQQDPRWAGRVDEKTGFQTKTMICVPLALEQLVFGSIQIINKTDGLAFDEKDLAFAEQLAAEIALLLKRKGLLDDYLSAGRAAQGGSRRDVSFLDVFSAETEKEMEYQLRSLEAFSALRYNEQQEALRLAKNLRKYFIKDNKRRTERRNQNG